MPRPKSFDPDTVLCKAMDVFWDKGYDAASISDLTAAMEINRFSLYDTFGDKHTLYLKALDSYTEQVVAPVVEKLSSIDSLDDLKAHFQSMADYIASSDGKPCCMMLKASVSSTGQDEETMKRIQLVQNRVYESFREVFLRLMENGSVLPDLDPDDTAMLIMLIQAGLTSFASAPVPTEQSMKAVDMLIQRIKA
jgi:TetR/AcrR family transcriptional regulator, transcriptional repressor for nem operon